jgi:hypothetical protein
MKFTRNGTPIPESESASSDICSVYSALQRSKEEEFQIPDALVVFSFLLLPLAHVHSSVSQTARSWYFFPFLMMSLQLELGDGCGSSYLALGSHRMEFSLIFCFWELWTPVINHLDTGCAKLHRSSALQNKRFYKCGGR